MNDDPLDVTLDKKTNPWSVKVSDKDHHVNHTVKLVWRLHGNAANGTFRPLDAKTEPGFCWIGDAPPSNHFDSPRIEPNGNLTMVDHDIMSAEDWSYQLCITVDGHVYSSTLTLIESTATNAPTIKND